MKICIIVAIAENGIIGGGNKLPWKIKSEAQYFARITKHKPVIMGRKTFESLGSPLKDRSNIVVTRDVSYRREGAIVTTTLEKAIDIAKKIAEETKQEEIMIGGGAEIYKMALPLTDRLYLTEVHTKPQGDTTFPEFDSSQWQEIKSERHKALEGESADYTIKILDRAA